MSVISPFDVQGARTIIAMNWTSLRAHSCAQTARMFQKPLELIAIALLLALTLSGLDANLFVVLLECGQILASLTELTFLHTLADIPVNEGALAVHEVKLVIDAREDLCNGGGVGDHAASTHHLGKITTRDDSGWLVVDAALESSWRPVDELNGALCFDGRNRCVHILGHHVSTVHHAARHVLAVTRIALHEHGGRLEHAHGNLCDGKLFMVGFLCGDDGRIAGKHEVDTWIWDKISLELSDVNVESTIETQGSCERGDDLRQEPVQVGVGRTLDVQVTTADIVQSLVVVHDGHVSVFQKGVDAKHSVVWLNHCSGYLRACPDGEAQLGLLAVIDGETLKHETPKTTAPM